MNQLCPFTGWLHEWFPASAILKASFMRTPRKLIPIPPRVVAGIDKIAGPKQRTSFIVDLLEREIRRHDQMEALREAAGCWKDEDHPELAQGSEAWVRQMRQQSAGRLERLQQLREAE